MNLRDIEYFLAVAEEGHFGRAAARCFVSQPTLSGQLKKLEEELGVALIRRGGREAGLTSAGEALLPLARELSRQASALAEAARALRDPRTGALKLGIIPTAAPYLAPYLAPLTRAAHPQLDLFFRELQTAALLRALAEGEVEAGILASPAAGLEAEEILREPFYLALPAGHPLARKRALLPADLSGLSLYLLEDGHCLKDQALAVCAESGAQAYPGFRASSLETLRQMIGAGHGATLMPALAVRAPVSRAASIRYLPFREPGPHRTLALAWRREAPRAAFFRAWAGELRRGLAGAAAKEA